MYVELAIQISTFLNLRKSGQNTKDFLKYKICFKYGISTALRPRSRTGRAGAALSFYCVVVCCAFVAVVLHALAAVAPDAINDGRRYTRWCFGLITAVGSIDIAVSRSG